MERFEEFYALKVRIMEFLTLTGGASTIEELGGEFNLDPFKEITQICIALNESGTITFDGQNISLLKPFESEKPPIQRPLTSEDFRREQRRELLRTLAQQDNPDHDKIGRPINESFRKAMFFSALSTILLFITFSINLPPSFRLLIWLAFFIPGIIFLIIGNVYILFGFLEGKK